MEQPEVRRARKFQREVKVGMIGVTVPIAVPLSYYSVGEAAFNFPTAS